MAGRLRASRAGPLSGKDRSDEMPFMSGTPTVSAIIPTHNRAHLVGRAIRSVLAQTFTGWECLVVDDASTDDTEGVVHSFEDPRIHYLRHEANKGGSAARNTGIRAARGEYLAFLDSDDEWVPGKLEKQLAVFASTHLEKLGIVLSGVALALNGRVYQTHSGPTVMDGWCHEAALAQLVFPAGTPTWLVKRSSFAAVPLFDETFDSKQDREYLVRATREVQLAWVPESLVIAHKDGSDHIGHNNANNRLASQLRFLEKYGPELRRRPSLYRRYHHGMAQRYYSRGDMKSARRHLWLAVRAEPRNPKAYPWLMAAYLGRTGFGVALRAAHRRHASPMIASE